MRRMMRRRPRWLTDEDAESGSYWAPIGWRRPDAQLMERTNGWAPAVDMIDKDDRFLIYVELPGVPEDEIDITLHEGVLTIRGERTLYQDVDEDEWMCCERPSGTFYRAIRLPEDVDSDAVDAQYESGVLIVELPKRAEQQSHKIAISTT